MILVMSPRLYSHLASTIVIASRYVHLVKYTTVQCEIYHRNVLNQTHQCATLQSQRPIAQHD